MPGGIGVDGIRIVGEKEGQLEKIYSTLPKQTMSEKQKAAWKKAGPYDLSGLVSNGSVALDETSAIGLSKDGNYQG